MGAKKISLRARSVSAVSLLRPHLFARFFRLAACASRNTAQEARSFIALWNPEIPVRDYLDLGDNQRECTDAGANMMASRRDRTLMICMGVQYGNGWQPIVINGTAP